MSHVAGGARARLRGARRDGRRSHRLRQLLERRDGAELRVGPRSSSSARRTRRRWTSTPRARASCTALSTATAMIRTGVVRNAVVIGVELISPFMDWTNRGVAVLFGDGAAAVVLQATEREEGADRREARLLRRRAADPARARHGHDLRATAASCSATRSWDFDGQEIFKRAVVGNGQRVAGRAREDRAPVDEIDLVVPHQANLRIIEVGGEARRRADGARVPDGAALRQHVRRRPFRSRWSKRSRKAA